MDDRHPLGRSRKSFILDPEFGEEIKDENVDMEKKIISLYYAVRFLQNTSVSVENSRKEIDGVRLLSVMSIFFSVVVIFFTIFFQISRSHLSTEEVLILKNQANKILPQSNNRYHVKEVNPGE